MRLFIAALGAGVSALALVAASSAPGVDRVAYFKTENRNRIMIFAARSTVEDARSTLERVMWTEGQLTRAYLYDAPAALLAAEALQRAPANVSGVLRAVENTAPDYLCSFTIYPTGKRKWLGDCFDE